MTDMTSTQMLPPLAELEPFKVHCPKCSHERVLCYAPVPVDVFVAVAKLRCVRCGSKKVYPGPLPRETAEGDAIEWLTNGDTGTSSETIWSVMMDRPITRPRWFPDTPHDPDDFGRCYRLLNVMPSWRARLPEVGAKYPIWRPLVEAWDELTALWEAELPSGRLPKLYARIQELKATVERT
jgi:hypothetical protein